MKGSWCAVKPTLFCQESAGCQGCMVYLEELGRRRAWLCKVATAFLSSNWKLIEIKEFIKERRN